MLESDALADATIYHPTTMTLCLVGVARHQIAVYIKGTTKLKGSLVAIAWRVRQVDAVVVVGAQVDKSSVAMEVQTETSYSERSSALAHIFNVCLVLHYFSRLRNHVVGCNIVQVLGITYGSDSLEVKE